LFSVVLFVNLENKTEKMLRIPFLCVFLLSLICCISTTQLRESGSFTIDHENDSFLKDGEQFRFVAGSLHYFRVHPSSWADRLAKLRYAGLNAVSTYVEWASHEPEPGQYDFSGGLDLVEFIEEAQRQDLLVILRVGPYICAERDMGGLPYWLLRLAPEIKMRTEDVDFMTNVNKWLLEGLFPRIEHLLYENGGPIIMVQAENEYGQYYACSSVYRSQLRDTFVEGLGNNILLFTTDIPQTVFCGKMDDVYATIDFGPGRTPESQFPFQRYFEPTGPLVNSEYYTGWIDQWGLPKHSKDTEAVTQVLDEMLAMNASVNFYVFHGGSNFGFTGGANDDHNGFRSVITSYDYGAPMSEAGDLTAKYWAIRDVVAKYLPLPDGPAPVNTTKAAYGPATLEHAGHHLSLAAGRLTPSINASQPLTFEELSTFNGLVAYSTVINFTAADPELLNVGNANDRTQVFVNGEYVGTTARSLGNPAVPIRTSPGDVLTLLVESLGHVTVGFHMNDFKGLTSEVSLGSQVLQDWTMSPLPLQDSTELAAALNTLEQQNNIMTDCCGDDQSECSADFEFTMQKDILCTLLESKSTGFFTGSFEISGEPNDTFLKLEGWTKGMAWVNGFNLGRYWPVVGPQLTLYVPRAILREGANALLLLELEGAQCSQDCSVEFVDTPEIDASVPK